MIINVDIRHLLPFGMSVFFHLNQIGLWWIQIFPPGLPKGTVPSTQLAFPLCMAMEILWFLLQLFWWVWGLQGPRIYKFQFQLVQNNSHLLVPWTFLFFDKDFKRPEIELSAFTMKEQTRSRAKRNILELFGVNSKQ